MPAAPGATAAVCVGRSPTLTPLVLELELDVELMNALRSRARMSCAAVAADARSMTDRRVAIVVVDPAGEARTKPCDCAFEFAYEYVLRLGP